MCKSCMTNTQLGYSNIVPFWTFWKRIYILLALVLLGRVYCHVVIWTLLPFCIEEFLDFGFQCKKIWRTFCPFWFRFLWHINPCRLFNAKSSLYIYIKYIWFGWVGFYGISTIVDYLMPNPLYTYISNMIWFGWVLWHINPCRLFNAKSSLYIYIKYIWFGLVGFYGISTLVGYLMPNPLYTYILNMIWLGWVLWHIKPLWLFNAKSSLYIYIKYIWFVNTFCR